MASEVLRGQAEIRASRLYASIEIFACDYSANGGVCYFGQSRLDGFGRCPSR